MKRVVLCCFVAILQLLMVLPAHGEERLDSYEAYIDKYYRVAQEQQRLYGIPASITLAQGLLESAAGGSKLAVAARNHFGIKCHDWEGDAVKYKGDCYRMYGSVEESYTDHSMFLLRDRYKSLYELDIADYKGWAHGLKQCGYAEDPNYADKLIEIVERYDLLRYVVGVERDSNEPSENVTLSRDVFRSWGLLYVIAREGDSYDAIAADTGFKAQDLAKYNDDSKNRTLREGDIVYLEKKKAKADKGYDTHTVVGGETMRSISQLYGIDVHRLARRNKMRYDAVVEPGKILRLR